jgi:tripartite ATP-independent transporter DctM subunit
LEWQLALLFIFGGLIVLLLTGLPVAIAFMVINVIGLYFFWGGAGSFGQLILSMKESVASFVLLPFPLFILLGEILFQSGMAGRAINVIDMWLGRVPGRLSLLAVGSGTVVGTISGSGVASAALLASTLVPEMEKRGYKTPMSVGPVLGSGGLAMIIPPSGDIVLIASLAVVSVGKLLMAGVMPGILMAINYAIYIIGRCYFQPDLAPPYKTPPIPLLKKIIATVVNSVPVTVIIFLVTGVIFLGIATPSEAAAMGALGAFVLAACYRSLNWRIIKASILGAGRITVMLLAILLGAMAFSQILAYTGALRALVELAASLPVPPVVILIGMMVLILILGCFMDEVAIMLMMIPIYMPIVHALGFNPLWFLILYLINAEMGLTTPPFGLILFVVKGVLPPDRKMTDLYKAAAPFLVCDAISMTLIIAFPQIALWLPSIMITR